MSDFRKLLSELRRPRLLMRAARHGQSGYCRAPVLRRLAPDESRPEGVMYRLLETEARHEATRRTGEAGYSPAAHVEALVALLAEAARIMAPEPVRN